MRIAFYVARFQGEDVQTPPSLQCLAGYLLGKGLVEEEDILFANRIEQVVAFNPDILGVGSVSQCVNNAISIAREVRSAIPCCWNILGGYHISALPETLSEAFDIGVIGEGELTLAELVSLRLRSDRLDTKLLGEIKGLCFRDKKGMIVQTPRRPLIEDIDVLQPFPRLPYGQEWAYLFTARGCPYRCMYCASHTFWEHYRIHSAEYVVNEIGRMVEDFGVYSIYFVDDLFIAPKKRLREIRRLIEERGWLGKIRFKGFVRVNLLDEEVLGILKEMGFIEVRFGMETASERLIKLIKNQPFTIKQAESVIENCNKYKIPVCASFMFGIPGEDENDINASRDFLRKHRGKFKISGFYLMQPVPGAKLWEDCLAKDLVSPEIDFSSLELDFTKKDFDWNRVLYLNAEKIPLPRFRKIIEEIHSEFINPPTPKRTNASKQPKPSQNSEDIILRINKLLAGFWETVLQKSKTLITTALRQTGYEICRIQSNPPQKAVITKPEKKSGLRLNIGCSGDAKEGFVGCDIRPLPNVSIVCKAWEISQYCTEVKKIYSRHMLEHLTLPQVEATLCDWIRALSIGGKIHIVVPNMDFHVEQWRHAVWNEETWKEKWSDARYAFAGFWGWQRESDIEGLAGSGKNAYWDVHKCGFNKEFLTFLLNRAGFSDVRCEIVDNVHLIGQAVKD